MGRLVASTLAAAIFPRSRVHCPTISLLTSPPVERQNNVTAAEQAPVDATDAELIVEWQGGDEGAAAALVRRHTPAVARFLAASGAREDLDDLVQETFFRAFRRLESFRGTASFRTWLLAIGGNALKDVHRRRVRRPVVPIEDREFEDPSENPHDRAIERDLLGRLGNAIERLTPMQKQVFLLRAQQGEEYEDIATVLGTTVGAARVHYHHAVKRLKAALSDDDGRT